MPGPYTIPFTFIPLTTIFSGQVNTNFTTANNNLNSHETGTTGIHGVGAGSIVGTTLVQTLTNKTLTSPVINNPTIAGVVAGSASYTAPTITGTVAGGATYTAPTLTAPVITGGMTVTGASVFNTAISLTGHAINNVLDPVGAQDAATKNYVGAQLGSYIPLSNAGNNVTNPTHAQDVVTVNYLNAQGFVSGGPFIPLSNAGNNVSDPTHSQDVLTRSFGDGRYGQLTSGNTWTALNDFSTTGNIKVRVNSSPAPDLIVSQSLCKAWGSVFGSSGNIVPGQPSLNFPNGITRNSQGDYSVTWTTPFSTAGYPIYITIKNGVAPAAHNKTNIYATVVYSQSTTGFSFVVSDFTPAVQDPDQISIMAFGLQ